MAKANQGKIVGNKAVVNAAGTRPKWKVDWMLLVIIAFCFVLYGNTIPNRYAMDDELVTTKTNALVSKGIAGIPGIMTSLYSDGKLKYEYRPVVKITYAIEYQIFGENPQVSHFINILIYMLTCLLLFRLLQKMMPDYNKQFLFFIVLLFLAHPVHTEVVASLKNRDEMLSFLFSIVAMNYLLGFVKKEKWISLVLAFVFSIIAYLSKASALVFLVIFPLTLHFFTNVSWKKLLLITGMILLAFLLTRYLPKTYLPKPDRAVFYFENPLFEYKGLFKRLPIAIPLGMMSLWFYIRILIFPHPLLFYYGYDMIPLTKMTDPWVIAILVLHVALFLYALWNFRKKHLLAFAILYYLICISMFSNIIKPAMGIVAERFVYAASLGFCIVAIYFVFKIFKADVKAPMVARQSKAKILVLLSIILLMYSIKTISRNPDWKNHKRLYSSDIAYLEKSAKANALLAGQMMSDMNKLILKGGAPKNIKGKVDSIIFYYNKSIEIYPGYYSSYNNIGSIYFTILANSALHSGDTARANGYYRTAISWFGKALEIEPEYPEALFNTAYSYEMIGVYDTALVFYRKNIGLKPDNLRALSNMANMYNNKLDQYDSALAINKRIMKIDSSTHIPYINMGSYAFRKGDTTEAMELFEKAMVKFPGNVELATKLSNFYRKSDPGKSAKYNSMAIDAKKAIEEDKK